MIKKIDSLIMSCIKIEHLEPEKVTFSLNRIFTENGVKTEVWLPMVLNKNNKRRELAIETPFLPAHFMDQGFLRVFFKENSLLPFNQLNQDTLNVNFILSKLVDQFEKDMSKYQFESQNGFMESAQGDCLRINLFKKKGKFSTKLITPLFSHGIGYQGAIRCDYYNMQILKQIFCEKKYFCKFILKPAIYVTFKNQNPIYFCRLSASMIELRPSSQYGQGIFKSEIDKIREINESLLS